MANKRISELSSRTPSATDLMLVGDPTTGYSYKCLVSQVGGVTSVFGRTGAVTAQEGDYSLTSLSDVTITSPASGDILTYNGSSWVNSAGGFVPYTGATANVSLGEYGILAGWYRLDLTPTGTPTDQGTMYWDDNQKTLALIMNGTTQKVGHDQFYYAKNSTGTTIPKGTTVRFAGTDGGSGHLLITPFLADGSNPSSYFMGVTAEAITNGSFGKVQSFGRLDGVDTSAFAEGDILYASTTVAGGFQTTVPVAPNNIVQVAAVVSDAVNGKLLIRPTLGSKLTSDESVKITSVANGNVLQYNSTLSVWENVAPSSLAVSNIYTANGTLTANRTVSLAGFSLTFSHNAASAQGIRVSNTNVAGQALIFATSSVGSAILGKYSSAAAAYKILLGGDGFIYNDTGNLDIFNDAAAHINFATNGSSTVQMRLASSGNLLINTTTDAGFRLDVNGTMRVQNTATFSNPSFTGSLTISTTANNTHRITATGLANYIQFGSTNSIQVQGDLIVNANYDLLLNRKLRQVRDTQYEIIQFTPSNDTKTGWNLYTNYVNAGAGGANTGHFANIIPDFTNATTGTYTFNVFRVRPNINVTAGTNIVTGILYDPVLTSTTGLTHTAMRLVTGDVFMCVSSGYAIIGATGDTTYRLSVDGDLRVYGNIRTAQPTGGTGVGVWRLGSTATGTFTLDTTTCVEIEIGGSLIKVATVS